MEIKLKTSSKVFHNRNIKKLEKQGEELWLKMAYDMGTDWDKQLISSMKADKLQRTEREILTLITGDGWFVIDNSK